MNQNTIEASPVTKRENHQEMLQSHRDAKMLRREKHRLRNSRKIIIPILM